MNAGRLTDPLNYGEDELGAIADLFGAPHFPGVADGLASGLSEEAREAALRSARRSLLARGVLEIDDEGMLQITPPHSVIFRIALAPAAVVNSEHRRRDAVETRSYYVLPTVGVEHRVKIGRVHSLEQFAPEEMLGRVCNFAALAERPTAGAGDFDLTVEQLNRALAGDEKSDLPSEAAAFAAALADLVSTSYVRCLHRQEDALVGGELRWLDTGDSGLWLVEPSGEDPERVSVRPTHTPDLLDELLSYLPGGERQPAAT
jgi:hypothetical protein